MRGKVRALIAVLLLALFPFVVVALGVGGAVAGLLIGHRVGGYLAVLGIGLMVALGVALVQAWRTRLTPPPGPRLTRQDQPELWQLVDELAALARTRPPDEIILVGEVNAAVCEDARALGLRSGRRFLAVGLPLLAGLNVSELRSVLAHELGHYGGGHTRLGALSYRGAETLERTVARFRSGPVRWVLHGYAWLYAVVSRSANRAQELQADAYSAAAVGKATATVALRKIATLEPLWEAFTDRYLRLAASARRTPDILAGFRSFTEHPRQREAVAEVEPRVLDAESHSLFDSHPTIRRRIAALDALPEQFAPEPDDRPAWTVLASPDEVLQAAQEQLYLAGDLGPRASWPEIVRLSGAADAAQGAGLLATAARESGLAPNGTLGEILNALYHGRGEELMRPLLGGGENDPDRRRQASQDGLTELLGDVILSALIDQHRAYHSLDWGGPWRVIGPGGEMRLDHLVGPAVRNPELVPTLARQLDAMSVPATFARLPSPAPTGSLATERERHRV